MYTLIQVDLHTCTSSNGCFIHKYMYVCMHTDASHNSSCTCKAFIYMVYNNYCPDIFVDPETYEVTADGEILTCEPATELPMAQRYFLF